MSELPDVVATEPSSVASVAASAVAGVDARRRLPFPDRQGGASFNKQFTKLVGELLRQVVESHIPPENASTFRHGGVWTQRREDGRAITSGVKPHSAATQLRFADVVDGNPSTVVDQVRTIVQQMEASFMRMLYETVNAAVEEVGNVVDGKNLAPTTAFLETLRKIEFGVNRRGEVTRPEIHLHPDAAEKFIGALRDAGPAFEAEVNQVAAGKEAEALERERVRKARFKMRSEEV